MDTIRVSSVLSFRPLPAHDFERFHKKARPTFKLDANIVEQGVF